MPVVHPSLFSSSIKQALEKSLLVPFPAEFLKTGSVGHSPFTTTLPTTSYNYVGFRAVIVP
jgi:hypothetical protein